MRFILELSMTVLIYNAITILVSIAALIKGDSFSQAGVELILIVASLMMARSFVKEASNKLERGKQWWTLI